MTGTISAVMRAIIDRVYPVGIIIDFAVETNPNSAVGCGTKWQRIADGRALIASDTSHPVGWVGGSENVTLGVSQIPTHRHVLALNGDAEFTYGGGVGSNYPHSIKLSDASDRVDNQYPVQTIDAGSNQPHNNMQPSLAVARWKRVT